MPFLRHRHTVKSFSSMMLVGLAALPSFASLLAEKVNLAVADTVVDNSASETEVERWKPITLNFEVNPNQTICEDSQKNPFFDYRLDIFLRTPNGTTYEKPVLGFYAADGNADETQATCGNVWRAYFVPNETGRWEYTAVFSEGSSIAVSGASDPEPVILNGAFTVVPSTSNGDRSFYSKGFLRHPTGSRYYRFDNGEYFLKSGPNSPETFLGYIGFDGTPSSRAGNVRVDIDFDAHIPDYTGRAPLWRGDKGRGILGAIDYLSQEEMNVVYMLAFNAGGDAQNVWPYNDTNFFKGINKYSRYQDISHSLDKFRRFDVSKLAQWNRVFTHMMHQGVAINFVLSEEENQILLGGGGSNALTDERKLFYRELVARFSHHNALFWNIGEENGQTNPDWNSQSSVNGWFALHEEREQWINYLYDIDPYQHPITLHTIPTDEGFDPPAEVYENLLGNQQFSGPSMQLQQRDFRNIYNWTQRWITQSADAGYQWVVNLDEYLNYNKGVYDNHEVLRKEVLWPHFMAGGAGVEWYYGQGSNGFNYDQQDINWRGHEGNNEFLDIWRDSRNALQFFKNYGIPFWNMIPDYTNTITSDSGDFVLSTPDESLFVIYRPQENIDSRINLPEKEYYAHWYNPVLGEVVVSAVPFDGDLNSYYPIGDFISENSDWVVVISDSPDFPKQNSYYFSFDDSDEGWFFVQPEGFGELHGYSSDGALRVSSNGIAGVGFWDSPVLSINPSPQVTGPGGRLYKATYFVSANRTAPTSESVRTAPNLRFRTAEEDFSYSAVSGVESLNSSAIALPDQSGRYYTHYFVLPHEEGLRVSFDTIEFSSGSSVVSEIVLESVEVTSEPIPENEEILAQYDLQSSDAGDWEFVELPLTFSTPLYSTSNKGLSLAFKEGSDKYIFGFWKYTSDVTINAGRLYRVDFTVGSEVSPEEKSTLPTIRLRVNSDLFHYYSLLNIDGQNDQSVLPSANAPEVYSLYFVAPDVVDGQKMLLSFDILSEQQGSISLEPVYLERVEIFGY